MPRRNYLAPYSGRGRMETTMADKKPGRRCPGMIVSFGFHINVSHAGDVRGGRRQECDREKHLACGGDCARNGERS